jgi:hypothetical protein
MPTPHYNYYPPSGAVLDQNEPRAYWNGRAWMLNNRVYGVPSGHRLIGRAGGQLNGWYYDWSKRAWMEPDKRRPNPPPNGGVSTVPQIQPTRPQVQPQPQPAPKPATKEKAMPCSNQKDPNVLQYLVQHPIAPLAGAFVLVGSMLAEEPLPPQIPEELPEVIQKQWQMIYSQNLERFRRRMALWETIGTTLLGYADSNALLAALPAKKTS